MHCAVQSKADKAAEDTDHYQSLDEGRRELEAALEGGDGDVLVKGRVAQKVFDVP